MSAVWFKVHCIVFIIQPDSDLCGHGKVKSCYGYRKFYRNKNNLHIKLNF